MKTSNRNRKYHLNVEVRRGIFAWITLIISASAIFFFSWYTLHFLGISIIVDSILNLSENSINGMTLEMKNDLDFYRNLQNHYLLESILCIPALLISFGLILVWEQSKKKFLKSLIFKK